MPSIKLSLSMALIGTVMTFVFVSAAPNPAGQDPQTIALQAWQEYLQSIGWKKELSERHAPRFLGVQKDRVANEHGGVTVMFDGSQPGMRATVSVVLDPTGKLIGKPVVELADVLEAR